MTKQLTGGGFYCGLLLAVSVQAEPVRIDLQLPAIDVAQYKRPFVAVWVEQAGQKQAVRDLQVWYDDKKWLKDLRRWWRKSGRYQSASDNNAIDGITAATQAPGRYSLQWDGTDNAGNNLSRPVTIYLESVREHGDRSLLKQEIRLGQGSQQYSIEAGAELGPAQIMVGESYAAN